ncbi:multiple sugar transport system substrate-binding protein [Okibacterium sp. HSC-33S16]|uniref:extracellular solute-binding protein n=1 Tax=Okibacterium sp. HSC-33S16 TaxID=2910965 RepID=UPI00209FC00B|nr:extracellular solute-binding protein [Okibacterium sp. HSC-33S16]MCP2032441.1 multiple sugar transport system substrate-binding protein [Okibacterium sp. HSC-33S16]
MLSRKLGAVGALLVSATLLTGCSTGGSTGGDGSGSGTVKMVAWPGPEGDAMKEVVDAYNAGQGKEDDINVELVLLSRQDTFSKETALMSSKSSDVDVYWTASYNVGQFSPSLEPLDDIDTSNYFPVATEGLTYNDKLYALPLDVSNHFLLYRTDLIDGLLNDPAAVEVYKSISADVLGEPREPVDPQSWDLDDYKAMSAYFSKSTNADSPTQYGTILQAKNLLYNTMIWNDVLWGYGGNWAEDGKATIDSDAGKKAVQLYADIYKNKWTSPDSAQAEFPETQAALQSGNVAFAMQWSAAYAALNDPEQSPDIAGKIGIAPVPGGQTHVHALSVSLNKYSKNKAAAKTLLSYLATTEAMTAYAEAGGIPAMPEVLSQNEDLNPAFGRVSESISEYGYSEPVFPKTFQAYSALAEALSGAWVGETPVNDAVKNANEALQELLD